MIWGISCLADAHTGPYLVLKVICGCFRMVEISCTGCFQEESAILQENFN